MKYETITLISCEVLVTKHNLADLRVLPNVPQAINTGDILEYEYSVGWTEDLQIIRIIDAEYKALRWLITTYPTAVNHKNLKKLKVGIADFKKRMEELVKLMEGLVEGI